MMKNTNARAVLDNQNYKPWQIHQIDNPREGSRIPEQTSIGKRTSTFENWKSPNSQSLKTQIYYLTQINYEKGKIARIGWRNNWYSKLSLVKILSWYSVHNADDSCNTECF